MVQHKPTPEEQLLKLIEDPGGSQDDAKKSPPAVKKPGPGLPDFGKLFGRLDYLVDFFRKKVAESSRQFPIFNIKWVNRGLLAIVLASAIYLLFDLFVGKPSQANFLSQVGVSDAVYPVQEVGAKGPKRELAYYKQPVARRNPFLPPSAAPAESSQPATTLPPPTSTKMASILQGLKLVGIAWGPEPLAMIEEVQSGRTYFLKQGQEVQGLKVQSIHKEKVTVTYEGEEGELF